MTESFNFKKITANQLDENVHSTNVHRWYWMAGVVLLLGAILIWGLMGEIQKEITTCAIQSEDGWICYIPRNLAGELEVGQSVKWNHAGEGMIGKIEQIPVSYTEAEKSLGSDYLAKNSALESWNCRVHLTVNQGAEDVKADEIVIKTKIVHPIELLLEG